MIKVNALFFLLLIESLVVLAAVVVFQIVRARKQITVHEEFHAEPESAPVAQGELQKHVTAQQAASTEGADDVKPPMPKANTQDHESCKMEVTILEEKLKEKTKLLIDLQAKFDSVEKEYLLLYQQQQAQEQHKN